MNSTEGSSDSRPLRLEQQYKWATCREPYRQLLNDHASDWINGRWSTDELAMELWALLLWAIPGADQNAAEGVYPANMDQVKAEIVKLAETLCAARFERCGSTPDDRADVFNRYCCNGPQSKERGL